MAKAIKRLFVLALMALMALMALCLCACQGAKAAAASASIESVSIKYSDSPNNPNLSKASSQYYTTTVKISWTNESGKSACFNDLCKLRAFTEAGADMSQVQVSGGDKPIDSGATQELTASTTKIAPSTLKGGRTWTFEVLEKSAEPKSFTASKTHLATYTHTIPLDAIPTYQRGTFS